MYVKLFKLIALILTAMLLGAALSFYTLWREAGQVIEETGFTEAIQNQTATAPLNKTEQLVSQIAFNKQGAENYLATDMLMERRPLQTINRYIVRAVLEYRLALTHDEVSLQRCALSKLYFGNNEFGLETASRSLFGKRTGNLSETEAVAIAALVRAPGARQHPERWHQHQETVRAQYLAPAAPIP